MSVRELLATHTSAELSEWRVFEHVHGFGTYQLEDVLGDIHEQLQFIAHLLGGAHFTPENKPEENPVPKPERYPRGRERMRMEREDQEE